MSFNLNYTQTGSGSPLVFQHGLGANISQSKKLLETVESIRLISLDCPGHGASPLSKDQKASFNFYAEEVIRLLDFLKIEKAIFGGISMGAGISLNIAIRFPERVNGLVLVRPAWLSKGMPDNLKILLKAADLIPEKDGLQTFNELPDFQKIQKQVPNAAKSVLGVFANTQRKEIPLVLKQMIRDIPFSNFENIKTIQKPCLILANEDDPLHPFEMAEKIHQEIDESKLHKVTSRYINDPKHNKEVRSLINMFVQKQIA